MMSAPDATRRVRDFLLHGKFADQDRLPPERDLACELGLTRTRLRTALDRLEAEGLIWRHVGRGTFVGRRPVTAPDSLSIVDLTNPREIMEARIAVEPETARLAAHRATSRDLALLRDCVRQGNDTRDPSAFQACDARLHRAIAEAAGNRLLLALYDAVHVNRASEVWGRLRDALLTEDRMVLYARHHAEIVAAISERDARRSRELMLAHLLSVESNIFREQ